MLVECGKDVEKKRIERWGDGDNDDDDEAEEVDEKETKKVKDREYEEGMGRVIKRVCKK